MSLNSIYNTHNNNNRSQKPKFLPELLSLSLEEGTVATVGDGICIGKKGSEVGTPSSMTRVG